MAIQQQRFTIYQDDDVTPLTGGSCTTDPAGTRPYLQRVMEIGQAEVDFPEGKSTIGVTNVNILDKRTVPTDQTTGWFTALLADPTTKNTRLVGYRAVLEQQDPLGTWYTVMNGVIGDVRLSDSLVEYVIELKDMRQREAKVPLFNGSQGEISLFPMGLTIPYGTISTAAGAISLFGGLTSEGIYTNLHPGVKMRFVKDPGILTTDLPPVETYKGIAVLLDMVNHPMPDPNTLNRIFDVTSAAPGPLFGKPDGTWVYGWAGVQWRLWDDNPVNSNPWHLCRDIEWSGVTAFSNFASLLAVNYGTPVSVETAAHYSPAIIIGQNHELTNVIPADGDIIEARILYFGPPTDDLPVVIEENFGQLLKDVYDGVYTVGSVPKIKYNATAMTDFIAATPLARAIITEPVEDLQDWVSENIYKPLGYAPVLNQAGEIVPVSYAIPDVSVVLTELDDTNVKENSAKWKHQYDTVINKVVFNYKRDIMQPRGAQFSATNVFIQRVFVTKDVQVIGENVPSAALIGPKSIEYNPVTIRALGVSPQNTPVGGDAQDELGTQLALAREKVLFDRFSMGAQVIELIALRSDPAIVALTVGDWVTLGTSYLPDYVAAKRGIDRIGQIISISDKNPLERDLIIVDSGPSGAPLAQPTVGTILEAGGYVEVPITSVPSGADARVDYYVGDVEPSVNSGLWTFAGRKTGTGIILTPAMPVGVVVWIRARSEQIGKRPSAWTNPVNITTVLEPVVRGAVLDIHDGQNPVVRWDPDIADYGYRIWWQQWKDVDGQPGYYTNFIDVNASAGTIELPTRLLYHENILVAIDPSAVWPIPVS